MIKNSNGMNTERTPDFLMANLGAEVSRIFSAKEKSDTVLTQNAKKRAQAIIFQIIQYPEMRSRTPEIEMLSSVISDISSFTPKLRISRKNLSSYFYPFVEKVMQS
ncbi:MAG: hypothetical protein HY507_00970 [Candidatus Zambryskibacteria bacterium]|nr:hypothetical protein [Candidatus Zambryskibacteria bacterium]